MIYLLPKEDKYMTDKEIMVLLRRENKENERILKELIERRIKDTSREKFSMQEIYYFSNYFKMPMSKLLLQILDVNTNDYKKFLKGHIKLISSEKYRMQKEKMLRKARNIYKHRINWNIKNYYNKEKLLKRAKKFNINAFDFGAGVLQKSGFCIKRVLNDKSNLKRFYIGKYVNTSLPMEFVDNNFKELEKITKWAVRKAANTIGMRISKDEFNEEVQKCLVYALDNGNSLNKFSQPVIQSIKYKKRQGKRIYYKIYYYEMSEIHKLRYNSYYDDKIGYAGCEYNSSEAEQDIDYFIESLRLDDVQTEIVQLINKGYNKNEIIIQKQITLNQYDQIINDVKQRILGQQAV